jgi:hypothetical protein
MFKYKVMLELNLDDDKCPEWIIETLSTQLHDDEDILNYSITREDNQNDN